MTTTVREIMSREIRAVSPDLPLPALDRLFLETGMSGFPVVAEGRVVGLVSRADVVRQLCVEQSISEWIADDPLADPERAAADADEALDEIGSRVGERLEHLRVRDVMTRDVATVAAEANVAEAARRLLDRRVRRLLVVADGQPVGVVTATDIVRWVAE